MRKKKKKKITFFSAEYLNFFLTNSFLNTLSYFEIILKYNTMILWMVATIRYYVKNNIIFKSLHQLWIQVSNILIYLCFFFSIFFCSSYFHVLTFAFLKAKCLIVVAKSAIPSTGVVPFPNSSWQRYKEIERERERGREIEKERGRER